MWSLFCRKRRHLSCTAMPSWAASDGYRGQRPARRARDPSCCTSIGLSRRRWRRRRERSISFKIRNLLRKAARGQPSQNRFVLPGWACHGLGETRASRRCTRRRRGGCAAARRPPSARAKGARRPTPRPKPPRRGRVGGWVEKTRVSYPGGCVLTRAGIPTGSVCWMLLVRRRWC